MKKRDPLLWMGFAFLLCLLIFAIFGPTIRHDYLKIVGKPHLPPSPLFWLGTDELGRDIVSRLAFGARVSLKIGLVVMACSLFVGVTVGTASALGPKWLRMILMRLTDVMFAFPDILLAILVMSILSGQKSSDSIDLTFGGLLKSYELPVILALAVSSWPSLARLVATQVASLKDREYVVASKAMGASGLYLVRKHVLPHLWGILLAVAMVDLAGTILAESTLSFLGIGVQAPDPSWGSMINFARGEMSSYPLMVLWPCLFLSSTIFALNFVGDGLRAKLDPKNN